MLVALIICAAALALTMGLAVWLAWWNKQLRQRLDRLEAERDAVRKERRTLTNLQRVCESRAVEIRRLRSEIMDQDARYEELEEQAHALNVELFQESGRRILAEKADGAKRMQVDQLERELAEAKRRLRTRDAEANETERQLQGVIQDQQTEITRLQGLVARRAKKSRDAVLADQVTLDDLLG